MEAKDTVIKLKAVPNPIFEGKPNTYDISAAYTWGWKEGTEAQAPISFKAGQDSMLKEVKEWLQTHNAKICFDEPDERYREMYEKDWQAFLKGLDKEGEE